MSKIGSGRSPDYLVQKYIGTAYDTVKEVASNLDGIKKIITRIPELEVVIDNLDHIVVAPAWANKAEAYVHHAERVLVDMAKIYHGASNVFPSNDVIPGTLFYYTGLDKAKGLYIYRANANGLLEWYPVTKEGLRGEVGAAGRRGSRSYYIPNRKVWSIDDAIKVIGEPLASDMVTQFMEDGSFSETRILIRDNYLDLNSWYTVNQVYNNRIHTFEGAKNIGTVQSRDIIDRKVLVKELRVGITNNLTSGIHCMTIDTGITTPAWGGSGKQYQAVVSRVSGGIATYPYNIDLAKWSYYTKDIREMSCGNEGHSLYLTLVAEFHDCWPYNDTELSIKIFELN